MCGIGGLVLLGHAAPSAQPSAKGLRAKLSALSQAIAHRGPDGEGFFDDGPCALVHRLLRIYSPQTAPGPYTSRNGRWALTFNGEIYNHEELRRRLEANYGCEWRLHSDCEVLLEGWAHEGESFLKSVNGMFAFGLWDRENQTLTLGRDRLGEKPLYYSIAGQTFFFASEVKGLKALGVRMKLNREALPEYLLYRYVPGPKTLFEAIEKLLPGHTLTIGPGTSPKLSSYWQPAAEQAAKGDPEELHGLLSDSHRLRIQSAWQPGLLLSGGVDSSAVASFMPPGSPAWTLQSPLTPDESRDARDTCDRFGLRHKTVHLGGFEAQDPHEEPLLIQRVKNAVFALEEPLGDSIILATHALAKAVSQETRVVVSGEGADEVFGGYVHHWAFGHLADSRMLALRCARLLFRHQPFGLPKWMSLYPAQIAGDGRQRLMGVLDRMIAGMGPGPGLTSLFTMDELLLGSESLASSSRYATECSLRRLGELMALDIRTWLPDYTLHRLDKLMMSFGVESRLPFLDHRLVEYASRLPSKQLIRGRHRKWLLRKATERRLGPKVAWRKKTPFIVDMSRDDDQALQRAALDAAARLQERGLISPGLFGSLLKNEPSFLSAKKLFSLLVLDAWIQVFEVEV